MTRTNWTRAEIAELFDLPFTELVFRAAEVHREHYAAGEVQLCTLLSIKTGGCPEDCGYCSQSAHAETGRQPSACNSRWRVGLTPPADLLARIPRLAYLRSTSAGCGSLRFAGGSISRRP